MSSSHTRGQFGGDVAEVFYKYYVDGISYADVHRKPFVVEALAKDYAEQFVYGNEIKIRVKPGKPSVSIACI